MIKSWQEREIDRSNREQRARAERDNANGYPTTTHETREQRDANNQVVEGRCRTKTQRSG